MKMEEAPDAVFDDGTMTVVLNMAYRGDDIPDDVKNVYEYFRTGEFDDSNEMLGRLAEKVIVVNEEERDFIMTFEQELMMERREGIAEGVEQGKLDTAAEMMKDGMPMEKVIKYTGLTREVIEEYIRIVHK